MDSIEGQTLHDTANRRTGARLQDGSFWVYDYNHRDELTGARRYWYDLMPVAGQQFGFDYDNIGNRKTAQFGGDGSGLNLRGIGYAVNSLNQYTTITNLGYANILGAALATNGVWVNHGLAERKGEYFRKELSVANANGPLWTNVAVGSAGVTNGGGIIVPDDRQTLVYDLDGNLAFDGTWSYEWDGENRLKAMTMTDVATIPNPQRKRLEFGYDHMNRRISKVVKTWNGSSFTSPVTNLFVYDGWNLLAELNTLHSSLCTYLWGQDLSGTMDGAGGVGGLLMVVRQASPSTNCFVAFDGNGNVTALVNAVSGAMEARYEYSPYGEILRTTGPLASANPFRWSTKFWDEESGLVYYGYRYYSPALGRWVSRDPAEEAGGENLYQFVKNSPLQAVDPDGRTAQQLLMLGWAGATANLADQLFNLSSFTSFGKYGFGKAGTCMQAWAVGLSMQVDAVLGGRLLKNAGGWGTFSTLFGFGAGVGAVPQVRLNRQQSLAAAALAGRLGAVAAIGEAATTQLREGGGGGGEIGNAAYGFLQAARRGDTAYADLDAALLGAAIGRQQARPDSWSGRINIAGMFFDLVNGDAANAFSRLGSYQAMNAWDMAVEMEDLVEGM